MSWQLRRLEPALPLGAVKTYAALAPLPTHWRRASCAEVGCTPHEHGWRTIVDEATQLGQEQAAYIRAESGRHFIETREGGLTVFAFPAGQACFNTDAHRLPLEREPIFLVRPGDWRGSTGPVRRHANAENWVEDFAEHQDRIATRIQKG